MYVEDEDLPGLTKGERLIDMRDYLYSHRITHISTLSKRYQKSRTTIKKDLKTLELKFHVPFANEERKCIKVVTVKD